MDKAYNATIWENRPSTASPLDEINLNLLSQGVSTIDDRVIALNTKLNSSVRSVVTNENTGLITVTLNDGTSYAYNPATKIYNTISQNQQAVQQSFADVAVNFQDVHDLLDDMDAKIDLTASGANRGITNLQTQITQNDGYYRQEMSGIRTDVSNIGDYVDATNQTTNQRITSVYSSITQTTEAIQLSVTELSQSVDGDMSRLQAQITTQAGRIDLKVSKLEVIDDLQQEFGSGIQITPDRLTFASTGAMVVNTNNFKLDEEGNAEFKGHVAMDSGSVGGVPIEPSPSDFDSTLSIKHSHHSWKLRSAALSGTDERYYTYMTANKHLIVSNDEEYGHNAENDVTDDCTIGSKGYPWGAGYFKNLYVQKHSVIPEGVRLTLNHDEWYDFDDGLYIIDIDADNFLPGDTFFSIAVTTEDDLSYVQLYHIQASCIYDQIITFIATGHPSEDINIILLVEDYVMADLSKPKLSAAFNQDYNQLSLMWDSPDDGSKLVTWVKDEIVIEKYNSSTDSWEELAVFPEDGEDPFENDAYSDEALIIGSEGGNNNG